MKYLHNVNDNFTKLDVPDLAYIGYTVFEDDETRYPYFRSETGDELFLDDELDLYVIKSKKNR